MENRYFNRELSWLEFNARVLHQGLRKELPLMERLQFLSIVTSNFDEFFQVRVASLKRQFFESPDTADISGLTPQMVLTSISARAHQIVRTQQECLMSDILPALSERGLVYVAPEAYTQQQSEYLHSLFESDIYQERQVSFYLYLPWLYKFYSDILLRYKKELQKLNLSGA